MCVKVLYDPATFLTDDEYLKFYGKAVNVQREVEKPELYIIGRCASSDEQLDFVDTRIECLKTLADKFEPGVTDRKYDDISITDTMRFFFGDGPAATFEAGNNKTGHYKCAGCNAHTSRYNDLAYCYSTSNDLKSMKTFKSIRDKVLKGKFGKKKSIDKNSVPFDSKLLTR